MLSSNIPVKFGVPFASGAGASFITTPLPEGSQPAGRASLVDGFPPLTFDPIAAGGSPPWGRDMNGLMFQVTKWQQWTAAGGPVSFDATFAAKIGGYPKGAMLQKASSMDRYWISTAENNSNNPDTGGANWIPFPDVIVQKQAGNYIIDVGTTNAFEVTPDPLPASLADIVGSPIRVRAANANTSPTPTILIHNVAGDLALPMINANGAALLVNQIARANQIFEGFVDGLGFFQVAWPPPLVSSPAQQQWAPGQIIIWPTEIAPSGTLECNGQSYLITQYPNLFNVIQRTFGGDASHFNVPDLRGWFLRGWDHGAGRDPNAGTRLNRGDGTTGDHVGTKQLDAVSAAVLDGATTFSNLVGAFAPPLGFSVNFPPDVPLIGLPGGIPLMGFKGGSTAGGDGHAITSTGTPTDALTTYLLTDISGNLSFGLAGLETRPVNICMMFAIAY